MYIIRVIYLKHNLKALQKARKKFELSVVRLTEQDIFTKKL